MYGENVNYVYSVGFFVAVFLLPVLYLVWLCGVCWVMCVEGGFSEGVLLEGICDLYWLAGVNGERMVRIGGRGCDWGVWLEWVGNSGCEWLERGNDGDRRGFV